MRWSVSTVEVVTNARLQGYQEGAEGAGLQLLGKRDSEYILNLESSLEHPLLG
jgi:hypothetical protein